MSVERRRRRATTEWRRSIRSQDASERARDTLSNAARRRARRRRRRRPYRHATRPTGHSGKSARSTGRPEHAAVLDRARPAGCRRHSDGGWRQRSGLALPETHRGPALMRRCARPRGRQREEHRQQRRRSRHRGGPSISSAPPDAAIRPAPAPPRPRTRSAAPHRPRRTPSTRRDDRPGRMGPGATVCRCA